MIPDPTLGRDEPPTTVHDLASFLTLRPYQITCVERVLSAFHHQPRGGRALLVLPTGSGKTLVFAKIAQRLGLSTLIIAHRQELLHQAAAKFRLIDPTALIGQVGAGKQEWGAPITVASVQTISRPQHLARLKQFSYDLVIIDECHHSASAGYQTILDALPLAFVLGVTATPDRLDKLSIEQIFGEPIFKASIIDMVRQGYLSNLRAIAIPTATSLDDLHTQAGDFKLDELVTLVDTPERNHLIVSSYLKHCSGRQALCFAVTVSHAQHLMSAFNDAGVQAACVCGETPQEERERVLSAYERGDLSVLCNVGVLTEGYDAPTTSCIIMARPTKSRALYVQSIGRGTRLAPGKRDCIILDITDNALKHRLEPLSLRHALDLPLLDGESILEAQKRAEQDALKKAEEQRQRATGKTCVSKRVADIEIDLLQRMNWQRRSNGAYALEVGTQKHLITLVPTSAISGHYSVHAQLAPTFDTQLWLAEVPLEWAMQYAEMKAQLIQTDDKKLILVDRTASWRSRPVTYKQIYRLRQLHIPFYKGMTCGDASDLIDNASR